MLLAEHSTDHPPARPIIAKTPAGTACNRADYLPRDDGGYVRATIKTAQG
jgi:hypothetical protein